MLNHISRLLLVTAFTLAAGRGAVADDGATVRDFYDVVAPDGADPWVIRHTDGRYYATMSTGRDVTLRRSSTLSGLGGGERKVVWTPPRTGPSSKNLWAPEIHRLRGKWYVYFAADDGPNEHHRMFVLENASDDPFRGEFVEKGRVFDPTADRWAIDGTAREIGGRLFFVWSGWEGAENVAQNLYIAPMRDPWTLGGPRVEISRPTLDWERRGGPPSINEGPQFLARGKSLFLVYSGAGSWTDDYCLGLLALKPGGDPLDPSAWAKHPGPVFATKNGVFGPGHCSFVGSPDGAEDWVVYHAAKQKGSGWSRNVRAQRFTWDDAGRPVFGEPAAPDTPIALPSGEPPHVRYEAESARPGPGVGKADDVRASGGAKLSLAGATGASVEFALSSASAGAHALAFRYILPGSGDDASTLSLTVNDKPAGVLRLPATGAGNWSNALARVDLSAGTNRVRVAAERATAAELDALDVIADAPGAPR